MARHVPSQAGNVTHDLFVTLLSVVPFPLTVSIATDVHSTADQIGLTTVYSNTHSVQILVNTYT